MSRTWTSRLGLIATLAATAAPVAASAQPPAPAAEVPPTQRVPADAPPAKAPPQGPYEVEIFTDPSLPTHTIYAPAAPRGTRLPVVAYGNGGCQNNNQNGRALLTTVASHGFLVIAPGSKDSTDRGSTKAEVMKQAFDWAERENTRSGSRFAGAVDTGNFAVVGFSCGGLQVLANAADPRVKSALLLNSGAFPPGQASSIPVTKDTLKTLHTPVGYVIGGPVDVAYPNAEADFAAIEGVPVFKANINTGHPGTFRHPGGGWYAEVTTAWLRYTLNRDKAAEAYFVGADCKLCTDPTWKVERKNFN